jgi:hypothetical protein
LRERQINQETRKKERKKERWKAGGKTKETNSE